MNISKPALYDLCYSFKNYAQEATYLRHYFNAVAPGAESILDIGCGTGEHHRFLKEHFQVDGLDISEAYLGAARAKNPEGRYVQGDMRNFDTGHQYDLVVSLFSAIGYCLSHEELVSAFQAMARHLKPGGKILVEPWLTPEIFTKGRLDVIESENESYKVVRMNTTHILEESLSQIRMHYLIGEKGGEIETYQETLTLGLYSISQMEAAFKAAGLAVEYDENGPTTRGFYCAQKP